MKFVSKIYKKIVNKFKIKINLDKQKIKLKKLEDLFNYYGTDKGSNILNPYSKLKNKKLFKGHNFAKEQTQNRSGRLSSLFCLQ